MRPLAQQLGELLQEAGATVRIGLRQQGHLPTVERMRAEGASWDEIGKAIGWAGHAVERWYAMEETEGRIAGELVGKIAEIVGARPVFASDRLSQEELLTAVKELARRAFEAGFCARPKSRESWVAHETNGAPREWEFSHGGSAHDLMPEAWQAWQNAKASSGEGAS
jgi:hypothetical protein